jgi:hypothetical protein
VSEQRGRHALVLRKPFAQPRELVTSAEPLHAPAWRPDGSVITYAASGPRGPRLNMVILSAPPVVKPVSRTEVVSYGPVAWLSRNELLYAADGGIRRRDFGAFASSEVAFVAALELPQHDAPEPARMLAIPAGPQPARALAGVAVLPNGHVIVSALGDLWEIDGRGALVRRLTNDAYMERDPAVSADGRQLAFVSDRSGRPQIWRLDLATGDMAQLAAESLSPGHPAWSRAGDRIAYLGWRAPGSASLRVVDAAGHEPTELAAVLAGPGAPAWTPDDSHVGLIVREHGNAQLLLFPASGGAARRTTLTHEAAGSAGFASVEWTADGRSLLVASPAGVRVLPMLDDGLAGADWRAVTDAPARTAHWAPGGETVILADADGLVRVSAGAQERIPLPITWEAGAPGRTLIRSARVLDVESGTYREAHDVLLEGGRIEAVEPAGEIEPRPGDRVIEARGRIVMPGLIDLALDIAGSGGERLGRTLLAYGITTAQAVTASGPELRQLAESWQAHGAGPLLLESPEWCGGALDARNDAVLPTGAVRLCPAALGSMAPASADRAASAVWASSWLGVMHGPARAIAPLLPASAPDRTALVGTGVLYQDAIEVIVRSGATLVTGLAPRTFPALIENERGLRESFQHDALSFAGREPVAAAGVDETRRLELRERQRLLGRVAAGGGTLVPASGAPALPYGLGLHAALRLLENAGLDRAEVIRSATTRAAAALGLAGELGRVAPGQRADLLIVDGDPLADLDDLLAIETVIVGGRATPVSRLAPRAAEKFTAARDGADSK